MRFGTIAQFIRFNFSKSIAPSKVFPTFYDCTNNTKTSKASHIIYQEKPLKHHHFLNSITNDSHSWLQHWWNYVPNQEWQQLSRKRDLFKVNNKVISDINYNVSVSFLTRFLLMFKYLYYTWIEHALPNKNILTEILLVCSKLIKDTLKLRPETVSKSLFLTLKILYMLDYSF